MSKLIYVNADGEKVAEGSAEAAFQFHDGDVRLDKFRAAAKARKAAASNKAPAAEPAEADDDGSTERLPRRK